MKFWALLAVSVYKGKIQIYILYIYIYSWPHVSPTCREEPYEWVMVCKNNQMDLENIVNICIQDICHYNDAPL